MFQTKKKLKRKSKYDFMLSNVFRKTCLLWDKVGKYFRDRWQNGACALHAVYINIKTHTQNM